MALDATRYEHSLLTYQALASEISRIRPCQKTDAGKHIAQSDQQRHRDGQSLLDQSSGCSSSQGLDRRQGSIPQPQSRASSRDQTRDIESLLRIERWLDDDRGLSGDGVGVRRTQLIAQCRQTASVAKNMKDAPSGRAESASLANGRSIMDEAGVLAEVGAWLSRDKTGSSI